MERSAPMSSATTPTRDSWGRGASHGLPRRARGARGGGGVQGEMERAQVNWRGQNGYDGDGARRSERCGCCLHWRRRERKGRGECGARVRSAEP